MPTPCAANVKKSANRIVKMRRVTKTVPEHPVKFRKLVVPNKGIKIYVVGNRQKQFIKGSAVPGHPGDIYIENVFTELKRKGYGKTFVKLFLDECKKEGYAKAILLSKPGVREFWKKQGFEVSPITGVLKGYVLTLDLTKKAKK